MESIERLQAWYTSQCNGDWEHHYGVKIDTLDNPGWGLTIDLRETSLQGIEFEVQQETSEFDWYYIKVKNGKYAAHGDSKKLKYLIDYFLDEIVPKYSNPAFEYEILVPLYGAPTDVWTTGTAGMKDAGVFELISIDQPDYKTMHYKTLDNVETWIHDFEQFELKNREGDLVEIELVKTFKGSAKNNLPILILR